MNVFYTRTWSKPSSSHKANQIGLGVWTDYNKDNQIGLGVWPWLPQGQSNWIRGLDWLQQGQSNWTWGLDLTTMLPFCTDSSGNFSKFLDIPSIEKYWFSFCFHVANLGKIYNFNNMNVCMCVFCVWVGWRILGTVKWELMWILLMNW